MLTFPDLNKIKVFYTVYKTGNFVQAAESLSITRSAVSQALKNLEDELGFRLFFRTSKKMITTEPALVLLQVIEPFFAELEVTLQTLKSEQKDLAGLLRLGAPQDFGSTHLTEAMVAFQKKHDNITFQLVLETPVKLLELLTQNKLDIAFVDNGDFHGQHFPISLLTVQKENFVPVCSKAYFEKHLKYLPLRQNHLSQLDFIDYLPHGPVVKMWFQHQFGQIRFKPRVTFSAENVRALIKATEGDLGVAILPEQLIQGSLKNGQLKKIFSQGKDLINHISLARRLDHSPTAREKEFVAFYKNFAKSQQDL